MTGNSTRIQKAIAHAGLASRREAERMILAGVVKVNGEVVRQLGSSVIPGRDTLEVQGRKLAWDAPLKTEVWALYKPKNYVTTLRDPQRRPTVKDIFPRTPARLVPIGRLDYDAEGLLLLTNDGELANKVAHPSHSVPKTYLVKVKGIVSEEVLRKLEIGPSIEGKRRRPAKARTIHHLADKTWVEVTLKEGIQHHIKKMFLELGHRVLKIKRYRIGPIALEDLAPGESRRLSEQEIAELLGGGESSRSYKKKARSRRTMAAS